MTTHSDTTVRCSLLDVLRDEDKQAASLVLAQSHRLASCQQSVHLPARTELRLSLPLAQTPACSRCIYVARRPADKATSSALAGQLQRLAICAFANAKLGVKLSRTTDIYRKTLEASCIPGKCSGLLILFPRCLLHVLEVCRKCLRLNSRSLAGPLDSITLCLAIAHYGLLRFTLIFDTFWIQADVSRNASILSANSEWQFDW